MLKIDCMLNFELIANFVPEIYEFMEFKFLN